MVPGTTATRTRKPAPPVTVRVLDPYAGLYTALSSDGSTWYLQDLREGTCSCPAGARGFAVCTTHGECKHMIACRTIARALAHMSRAARTYALQVAGPTHVRVDAVLARQAAPAPGAVPALAAAA